MMTVKVYEYPKCGTCKKTKKWLQDNGVDAQFIHIVEETPTKEQIQQFVEESGLPIKRFFNTSGIKYKELNLKDKLVHMSDEEQYALLASDGMLIKRPLATDGKKITVGFKESDYEENWSNL